MKKTKLGQGLLKALKEVAAKERREYVYYSPELDELKISAMSYQFSGGCFWQIKPNWQLLPEDKMLAQWIYIGVL